MAKRVELPLGLRIVVLEEAYVIAKGEVVDFAVRYSSVDCLEI